MKIKSVSIRNFRKLKDISFECAESINSIVGPNGVGKSTILDAVRLTKALLFPTNENEAQTTLQFMGLYSPHSQSLLLNSIQNDNSIPTVVDIKIEFSIEELKRLDADLDNFLILRLQARLAQNRISNLNLISFLSTDQGKSQLASLKDESTKLLDEFKKNRIAQLRLTIDKSQISGFNGFHQEVASFLFRNEFYSETYFTIFPADRSFPTGDVPIQLGQNETAQQLQSYSIQPQLKFQRLKNALISYLLINNNDVNQIQEDFRLIFDNLIPGKQLHGINLENRTGKLSVLIKEIDTNSIYDIDFLSSGEKGLLLTIFLLIRTVHNGGIVLLDEPELHLNPAVCQNIVPFLKEYVCDSKNVQMILTTHSAEILASTKNDDNSRLLHLIDEKTISPIFKKDNEEAQEAIRCLGVETADLLFNKGVIYLEGNTDDDYLKEVLKTNPNSFKIQSLGGRRVIENEIQVLQEADRKKELKGYHVFVLDLDNKPTTLKSTENVIVIQWDRYSFENYFLNTEIMYDVIKSYEPKNFIGSRAEFIREVKGIALEQTFQIALFKTIEQRDRFRISYSKKELSNLSIEEIAKTLSEKIGNLKNDLSSVNTVTWEKELETNFADLHAHMKEDWEENWRIRCKGKELLSKVNNRFGIPNYKDFVLKLISSNRQANSEEWKIVNSILSPVYKK